MQHTLAGCGVMFHDFCSVKSKSYADSITVDEFSKVITQLRQTANICDPLEFVAKAESRRLSNRDIVLTFDDGLASQFFIALPVLEAAGLKAFFFIYTPKQEQSIDTLQIAKSLARDNFEDTESFYSAFRACSAQVLGSQILVAYESSEAGSYRQHQLFYTENDRRFRFVRDVCMTKSQLTEVLSCIASQCNLRLEDIGGRKLMSDAEISYLNARGHEIGLHSTSHPTNLKDLPVDEIEYEWGTNLDILRSIVSRDLIAASHPCGSYSNESLRILSGLGIRIGFVNHSGDLEHDNYPNLRISRVNSRDLLSDQSFLSR